MRVVCFSSFTFSYLNRARVLFRSLRKHQPHWKLVALITDLPRPAFEFAPELEPFDSVVYAHELGIPGFKSWLFKHDVVEACTAVKGPFMREACADGADAVIYLDPDTCVFNSLRPIEEMLETWDIILTPHTFTPETNLDAIGDNEIGPLQTGIYNLGFLAVRARDEGVRFANWWAKRLLAFCYNDIPQGLFVDQRWCDHVPSFFENVKILRDPGYNVASWNLSTRKIAIGRDGSVTVNGSPLRFWHFTKLGPIADAMTRKYGRDNFPVYEIWNWYKREVERASQPPIRSDYWAYAEFNDGATIEPRHRLLYRANPNLQELFPEPFLAGPGTYCEWLQRDGLVHIERLAAVEALA
jgi:hypothetical protein